MLNQETLQAIQLLRWKSVTALLPGWRILMRAVEHLEKE